MKETLHNVRHLVTCRSSECLLCKVLHWEAEKDWMWYILFAWLLFEYGILHG